MSLISGFSPPYKSLSPKSGRKCKNINYTMLYLLLSSFLISLPIGMSASTGAGSRVTSMNKT